MDENQKAKMGFIEAFFDDADERLAFLLELANAGHRQEALTLCLTYIDSFAQWLYWPGTQTGRNFVEALVTFGGDSEVGLIHPLQAQRAFAGMKGPWKVIAQAIATSFPGSSYELQRSAAFEASMSKSLTQSELTQMRAELWRGTIGNTAYQHLRNPSGHAFGSAGEISFGRTTYQGKAAGPLTLDRLQTATTGIFREARRRSLANNQWFGDDRIVGL